MLSRRYALRDVADVERFASRVLRDEVARYGAYLRDDQFEDALGWLIGEAWLLEQRYDPTRGLLFSTYLRGVLRLRVVDWYRSRFRDGRYNPRGFKEVFSLEQIAAWTYDQAWSRESGGDVPWWAEVESPREMAAFVLGLLDEDEPDRIIDGLDLETRIRRMPTEHQRALRALQAGLSYDETAALMGMSKKTLGRLRRRIERQLWPGKPPWSWRLEGR